MNSKRLLLALLILSLVVVSPGCDSSDPVASSVSTITVAANPRNIPTALAGLIPSTISAIVLTGSGVRQVGVEVIFTADEGCFGSDGNNCLGGGGDGIEITLTDSDGIASADLYTFVGTTVQAQSGSATGTETVTIGGEQVVTDVLLEALEDLIPDVPRDTIVEWRVTVNDSEGLPVPNAVVSLDLEPLDGAIPVFPEGNRTDDDGELLFETEVLETFDIQAQVAGVLSNSIRVLVRE